MNYSIFFILSAIIFLILIYISITNVKNSKAKINFTLILFSFVSFWWHFFNYIIQFIDKDELILKISKIEYIGVVFVPVLLYHFIIKALNIKSKILLKLIYAATIIFEFLLLFTDNFIIGHFEYNWGVFPAGGLFHSAFIIFVIFVTSITLFNIYKKYKKAKIKESKKQSVLMFIGISFFSLSIIDFFANYGFNVYPISFLATLLFFGFVFYAIYKYNLISANSFLDKFFVVAVLSIYVYIFWLLIFFIEQRYVGEVLSNHILILNMVIVPAFVFMSIEIFKSISKFSQNFFNIFKGKEIMGDILFELSLIDDDKKIPSYLTEKMTTIFSANSHVVYKNDGYDKVKVRSSFDEDENEDGLLRGDLNTIWENLKNRNKFTVVDEQKLKSFMPGSYRKDLIGSLDKDEIKITFPIGKNMYVLLGEKDNNKRYSFEEIKFLRKLSERFGSVKV